MKRRNFLGLVFVNFGVNTYWYVENFWINLYIVRNVSESALNVSYMVAVSAIVGVLTHIFFGALSDSSKSRIGRRKIYILWGAILGGITMSLFPLIKQVNLLFGVGWAIFYGVFIDSFITLFGDMTTPTRLALFKEHSVKEERGKLNFLIMLFSGFGAITIQILYMTGFSLDDYYFYIGAIFLVIGALGCIYFVEDPPMPNNQLNFKQCLGEIFQKESYRKNPTFYYLLFTLALTSFGINTFNNFTALYVEKGLGLEQEDVGTIVLIVSILNAMGILLPAFSDKMGRKIITLICLVLGGIMLIITTFFTDIPVIPLALLIGIATGIAYGAMGTLGVWIQDTCPDQKVSSLLAYQMVATVIPMTPGSLLGGFIADTFATNGQIYSPYFYFAAGIILLSAFIPVLLIGRKKGN